MALPAQLCVSVLPTELEFIATDTLVKLGANRKIQDNSGFTALDIAVQKENIEAIKILKGLYLSNTQLLIPAIQALEKYLIAQDILLLPSAIRGEKRKRYK